LINNLICQTKIIKASLTAGFFYATIIPYCNQQVDRSMTIQAMWIIGGLTGLLITVIGFMSASALSKISELEKQAGTFVNINKCDERKKDNDGKIDSLYSHQNDHYKILRQDIKDLGKEINASINRHTDDHLKAYHQ